MRISTNHFFTYLLLFIAMSTCAFAGVTGRLKGKAVDKETQDPLPGATIQIEGILRSVTTDPKGEFLIVGLDAGTYSIAAEVSGYTKVTYKGFAVYPDIVNEIHFELPPDGVHGEDIVLEADNISAGSDDPFSRHRVNAAAFSRQPHRTLNDIILRSAGDVYSRTNSTGLTLDDIAHQSQKLHFRGGAAGEAGYYLDGMRLNDGSTGHVFLSLPLSAMDLVTIQGGGYEAKYGQFGTGMVQIVPKRGGDTYTSSVEFKSDAAAGAMGAYSYGYNNYRASFGGPIIPKMLHFFVAGDFSTTDDADPGVFGHPLFRLSPDGIQQSDPAMNDTVLFTTDADGSLKYKKGPRPDNVNKEQWANIYGNVSYTPLDALQIDLTLLYSSEMRNNYYESYLFNPQSVPRRERSTYSTALSGKYALSDKMYVHARINFYSSDYELNRRDLFDKGINSIEYSRSHLRGNTFYSTYYNDRLYWDIGRGYSIYQKSESQAWSGSLEWNWQLNASHFIECGIGTQQHSERLASIIDLGNPVSGSNNVYGYAVTYNSEDNTYHLKRQNSYDMYNVLDGPKDPQLSYGYIQDSFTDGKFTLVGGLRYDYFNNGVKDYDIQYRQYKTNTVVQNNLPLFHDGWDFNERYYNRNRSYKSWSPRLGISIEIQKNLKGNLDYGWFYQIPPFQNILISNGLLNHLPYSYAPITYLKPQKTESIEVGITYLKDNVKLEFSFFRNDVTRMIIPGAAPMEFGSIAGTTLGSFLTFSNAGEMQTNGFIVLAENRFLENLTAGFSAFYKTSTLTAFLTPYFKPDWLYLGESQTSASPNYDQRITLRCFSDFQYHNKQGPSINGVFPLENTGLFIIANYGSGFRYTPTTIARYQIAGIATTNYIGSNRNSRSIPYSLNIDARISKQFGFFKHYRATAFIEVQNMLNRKNPIAVWTGTGDPRTDGYLATAAGQSMTVREKQQYAAINHNNFNYANPRLVSMGLKLEF